MKKLFGYVGRLGSGKGYCMMKNVEQLKSTGNSIYMVSFADPIKQILRTSFGLTKAGQTAYVDSKVFSKEYVRKEIVNNISRLLFNNKYPQFTCEVVDIKAIVQENYLKHEDFFYSHVVECRENIEYDYNFRRLAQLLGTELARHVVDSIWVDTAITKVKFAFYNNLADYAFIDDCRFPNEYDALIKFGQCGLYESQVIGVTVSDIVRAQRRGLTINELLAQDEHDSERFINEIIDSLPADCVIINEGKK